MEKIPEKKSWVSCNDILRAQEQEERERYNQELIDRNNLKQKEFEVRLRASTKTHEQAYLQLNIELLAHENYKLEKGWLGDEYLSWKKKNQSLKNRILYRERKMGDRLTAQQFRKVYEDCANVDHPTYTLEQLEKQKPFLIRSQEYQLQRLFNNQYNNQ